MPTHRRGPFHSSASYFILGKLGGLRRLGEGTLPCLFQLWWPQVSLGLGSHHSSLCLCVHMVLSLCIFASPLGHLHVRTGRTGLRGPPYSSVTSSQLILSIMTPFPSKIAFTGTEGEDFQHFFFGGKGGSYSSSNGALIRKCSNVDILSSCTLFLMGVLPLRLC